MFNWLFARHQGGQFVLRIEDTDQERSRSEYTENILEGLRWLGLTWDEGPFFQSQRGDLYQQAIQTLLDREWAYYCYCSEAELEQLRTSQKAQGQAPRYDNRHRHLTPAQQQAYRAEGREPVVRFKIDDARVITWLDGVRGEVTWKGQDLGGDMVIARASDRGVGQPLYNLAVVVDDIAMGITHVIRGEDHIANTAKQILLYEALGATVPEFIHTPLILNAAGQKLSKRDGVTSIWDFRDLGYTAAALVNYMTLLGWSPPDGQEIFTLDQAAANFSFSRVNRAGAKFDWDKLDWLNSQYLHQLPIPELTAALVPFWQGAGYPLGPETDQTWLEALTALIGPSLVRLKDAVGLAKTFFETGVTLDEAAQQQLRQPGTRAVLQAVLQDLDSLDINNIPGFIQAITETQHVKKGLVMRGLRAALLGAMHGPDLAQAWLLLHAKGEDRSRLTQALAVSA